MRYFIRQLFIIIFLGTGLFLNASSITEERDALFEPLLSNNNLRMRLLESGKKIPEDFDYSVLLDNDTDVLLIGEEHHNDAAARDVNVIIKDLKQRGVALKYAGSEFLLSSEQPYLDAYYRGEISYTDFKKKCRRNGKRVFIAEIAKRYKVRPIGLDLPKAQEDYNWAMSKEGLTARNQAWTDIIMSLKQKDPKAKMIVYGGAVHTATFSKYYPTVAQMLNKNNIKTKTLEFVYYQDKLWKQLNIKSNADVLFTIPPELKQYIQADYIILNIDNDLSQQDKAKLRQLMNDNLKRFNGDDMYSDACFNDPDNPVCSIIINSSRSKK